MDSVEPIGDAERNELTESMVGLIRAAKGDRAIYLQEKIERFVAAPDRRPIDPLDPRVKDGEYVPFLYRGNQPAPTASASASAAVPASPASPATGTVNAVVMPAVEPVGLTSLPKEAVKP